jgi:hypothetical protein
MACFVLVSCEHIDDAQQQRIRASGALRQFMTELQISLVERPPTNAIDIMVLAESFSSSSTNKPPKELRSVCDMVWVNNNIKHWLASSDTSSNTTAIAMIGQYQYDGRHYLIGITFSGDAMQQNGPPESGFTKLDLRSIK